MESVHKPSSPTLLPQGEGNNALSLPGLAYAHKSLSLRERKGLGIDGLDNLAQQRGAAIDKASIDLN